MALDPDLSSSPLEDDVPHYVEREDAVPADLVELEEAGVDLEADNAERLEAHRAAVDAGVKGIDPADEVDDEALFRPAEDSAPRGGRR